VDVRQLALELAAARPSSRTFGELATAWLRRVSKRRVCPANEKRHIRHMRALARLRDGKLTKAAIEDAFGNLLAPRGPLGPASINKLRSTGRLIIRDAQGNAEWHGLNPFELVDPMRPARLIHPTLTLLEVRRVLPKLRPDRRRLSKTLLLVGLRPGEALGLLKVDVDLAHRMLKVRRSHGRNRTKTGKEREFPIPDELVPTLRAAMEESPSEYVFPKPDGTRQRADTKLAKVLRTAIKAAGILTGYRFLCRKYSCAFEGRVLKQTSEETPCPECGRPMWFAGIPKHLRFYDLRHSSSTLHRKAKCDPLVVRQMMGHGSRNQTDDTYTHLDFDYQRVELNRLSVDEDAAVM
jgi:integrase